MQLITGALGRVISCVSKRRSPKPARDVNAWQRDCAGSQRAWGDLCWPVSMKQFLMIWACLNKPPSARISPISFVNKNGFFLFVLASVFSHLIFSSESNSLPTVPFLCFGGGDLTEQGGDLEETSNSSQKQAQMRNGKWFCQVRGFYYKLVCPF